ncbi:hypothetical protein J2R99_003221 [Rhodopseudomonas julia]|uniref:Uncharacterized protein n=1 Tax=Rhodopseudomonas julia TaxID=200617 RepID=A0ABU0CE52_9BRAD|nr:hypothetical protein [Rhodopseudomonas julia]MDQ0327352.1 hypothetical protein [Rhodopseudomonas julia]
MSVVVAPTAPQQEACQPALGGAGMEDEAPAAAKANFAATDDRFFPIGMAQE